MLKALAKAFILKSTSFKKVHWFSLFQNSHLIMFDYFQDEYSYIFIRYNDENIFVFIYIHGYV